MMDVYVSLGRKSIPYFVCEEVSEKYLAPDKIVLNGNGCLDISAMEIISTER